jgi:prophage antirepressor-like protein
VKVPFHGFTGLSMKGHLPLDGERKDQRKPSFFFEVLMKKEELITFSNPTLGELRGVFIEGEPWFLASEVCECLNLKNPRESLRKIREKHSRYGDEIKGVTIRDILLNTTGGKQKANIINESILYELIFQSQTKNAFAFQQWVFKEVLPSLRKHGEYRMGGKLIRRTLTDTIKDSGENERMHGFGYSTYSSLINKSLGLPAKVDRNTLDDESLNKVAKREDLVRTLIAEG